MMLKIFDRYIGKQILFTTIAAVLVLTVVLVLGNIFKKLITHLSSHPDLGWGFVLEFVVNVLPFSLIFTVPWAFLTAILLTYGRLSADSELTSLRMAGLSMPRICAPVFIVGACLTALTLWMNFEVSPRSQSKIHQIFFKLATENPGAMFVDDEIVNTLPGYSIYTRERVLLDKDTGKYLLTDFKLIKRNVRKRPEMFIRAAEAIIRFEEGNKDNLFLDLTDAHIEHTGGIEQGDFFNIQLVVSGEPVLQLSLDELRDQHRKKRPSFLTVPELNTAIREEQDEKFISTLLTERSKRFSLSLACATFCLIGIPLGVTAQRRETSVGFALSLMVGISYFTLMVIAEMFHDKPWAHPHLLIWLPNIVFIALGSFLFYRVSGK